MRSEINSGDSGVLVTWLRGEVRLIFWGCDGDVRAFMKKIRSDVLGAIYTPKQAPLITFVSPNKLFFKIIEFMPFLCKVLVSSSYDSRREP